MQLIPLTLLVRRCDDLAKRLERLDLKNPARSSPQPLFAVSGLTSDLQRVYAIEWILMDMKPRTKFVQAEVADAIGNLLETITLTYPHKTKAASTTASRGVGEPRRAERAPGR